MGQSLNVATEKKGYILTDRATYLVLKKNLGLTILNEGDSKLLNIYHVIELNPAKSPKINVTGGKAFADFMVSKKAHRYDQGLWNSQIRRTTFLPGWREKPGCTGAIDFFRGAFNAPCLPFFSVSTTDVFPQ